ncbi:disheveled-associated activator of morphogenesis 2 isoform X3 [Hermetia illucens]|uniref:disheveled-associated activator of morphogenesis 2 isoform X3 n=1 Tax=Hermetia illucens TaxID=343691 RepID=UPI0018CC4A26|nr:disheveled-associated activator of morphogenesis 2 isoform X3 [Hermetia illucens]
MEIFVAVPIFLFSTLIIIPIALYFCWRYIPYSRSINKKKRKRMAEEMNNVFYIVHDKDCNCEEAPVIVTSTTTTTGPGGYPITVQGTPGGGLQATPYPTTTHMPMPQPQMPVNPPYPTHGGAMPQPYIGTQGYPSNPPYPPMNDPSRMNPPSYDQVVSSEATQKQAPYNPNYMGN